MSALSRLMIAGIAAALFSAPVAAADNSKTATFAPADTITAQQDCSGSAVRCDVDVAPVFCIAVGQCATALTGSALLRYDQRMDAARAN